MPAEEVMDAAGQDASSQVSSEDEEEDDTEFDEGDEERFRGTVKKQLLDSYRKHLRISFS